MYSVSNNMEHGAGDEAADGVGEDGPHRLRGNRGRCRVLVLSGDAHGRVASWPAETQVRGTSQTRANPTEYRV